jgi:cold-inducible RNA-binding protein
MNNKIFVGGLSYNTNEIVLQETFAKYGKIINLRIVRNHEDGSSKGFGFITFSKEEEANASLELDGFKLDGRFIGVKIAHTPNRN